VVKTQGLLVSRRSLRRLRSPSRSMLCVLSLPILRRRTVIALLEVQVVPAEVAGLGRAQAVPVDEAHHDTIALGIPPPRLPHCRQRASQRGGYSTLMNTPQ
jgi:hypothetical protein